MSDLEQRFSGIKRLYGTQGLARLQQAHVAVVGIGGVGSWAVEALARTAIGELTLIDLDEVCVSNVNRQLHALDGEVGNAKVDAMARRVHAINPEAKVHIIQEFFTNANADELLAPRFDFVLDAIDNVPNKCLLIAKCRELGIPVVTTGGAGGRRDATQIQVADLALTTHDALLQSVRKKLRDEFGFPKEPKKLFGVDCVFSTEPQVYPHSDGTVCAQREAGSDLRLNCDSGYGTATYLTGTFGFIAAQRGVEKLAATAQVQTNA
ncbi:MAG: tRNA cyclic N6-threonylcarbamoyladenosine(37) synthase TcdA [Limisphaerales bacterium]